MSALIHETEIVVCACGHTAQVHHGVSEIEGCMIVGMRTSEHWCDCTLTATQVMEAAQ